MSSNGRRPILTAAQRSTLLMSAQGFTMRQIAERTNTSLGMVRNRLAQARDLLGARNTAHAVHTAHQLGIFDPPPGALDDRTTSVDPPSLDPGLLGRGRGGAAVAAPNQSGGVGRGADGNSGARLGGLARISSLPVDGTGPAVLLDGLTMARWHAQMYDLAMMQPTRAWLLLTAAFNALKQRGGDELDSALFEVEQTARAWRVGLPHIPRDMVASEAATNKGD